MLSELPIANARLKELISSNAQNSAYYIDEVVRAQWPLETDLDSTADNAWDTIPDALHWAAWIALRRMTKAENATVLNLSLTRPMKVYLASTRVRVQSANSHKSPTYLE